MSTTDRLASAADRGAVSLTEAVLLEGRVGETFEAGVLDVDDPPKQPAQPQKANRRPQGGTVAIDDPAVQARCLGALPLGDRIQVRLKEADPQTRTVTFEQT